MDKVINEEICANLFSIWFGFNKKELNMTVIPIVVGHIPAEASVNQVVHYGQLVNSGRFNQFDYGPNENMIRYKTKTPPDYNLTRITAPMYLFYSVGDWLADVRDTKRLKKELPNVKGYVKMDDPEWTHVDFVAGLTCKAKVFDKTIAYMNQYFT